MRMPNSLNPSEAVRATDVPVGDDLMSELKQVLTDAEIVLKTATDVGSEKLSDIQASVRESLRSLKEHVDVAREKLGIRARDAAVATDTYVHAHSWAAVGAASIAGLLVGAMLARR